MKWIDNETFATCSKDKTICVWNNDTKECKFTLEGHGDWVKLLAVDHTRNNLSKSFFFFFFSFFLIFFLLVSSSYDCTTRIWNLVTGECSQVFLGHTGPVYCFDFYEKILVTGSGDCTVRIWDMESGEQLFLCKEKNEDELASIQISPQTDLVITGGFDSKIRLWNYTSGKHVETLSGHTDWVYSLALYEFPRTQERKSSESKKEEKENKMSSILLISGSWDSTVKIWQKNAKTRKKKGKKFKNMFTKSKVKK